MPAGLYQTAEASSARATKAADWPEALGSLLVDSEPGSEGRRCRQQDPGEKDRGNSTQNG